MYNARDQCLTEGRMAVCGPCRGMAVPHTPCGDQSRLPGHVTSRESCFAQRESIRPRKVAARGRAQVACSSHWSGTAKGPLKEKERKRRIKKTTVS